MRKLGLLLLLLPACTWDWGRFDFADGGGSDADGGLTCRWDDPGTFTLDTPQPLTAVNSTADELDPFLSPDRLTLYFTSRRGDGLLRSYRATRSQPDGSFDKVEPQSGINVPDAVSHFALSGDGLTAYLSARSGYPADASGDADLLTATRTSPTAPFTSAQLQPISALNTADNEWDPFPAADGLHLYFNRHIPAKSQNQIMVARRSGPGQPWVEQGVVPGLALHPAKADNPSLTADQLLIVFSSDLSGSIAGSRDLWYALRASPDQPFGAPRQLPVVNTEHFESEAYITPDGCQLYFVRAEGSTGSNDLYFTRYRTK